MPDERITDRPVFPIPPEHREPIPNTEQRWSIGVGAVVLLILAVLSHA